MTEAISTTLPNYSQIQKALEELNATVTVHRQEQLPQPADY
ncbi:hypothetical protein [Halegenticoccus soli]|nr:hypothetical protein [Halegenticoccus soli]